MWGYIDKTGKLVIKPEFSLAGDFSEGLAAVEVGGKLVNHVYRSGKHGYIDKSGKFVIEAQFASASEFSEGLAKVQVGESSGDGKFGYIDKTGRMVIPPTLEVVSKDEGDCANFSEGLACIVVDGKVGFIDRTGKVVIKPQYEVALPFADGIALVGVGEEPVKWGYIDKNGKYIWQPSR
jgi:hypothetical protein